MAINVRSISFRYEEGIVLEDVSFEIKRGEFIGIFGPNGGGKTTLLKLIMNFLKPLKGTIEVLGLPPKCSRKKIGYVPQVTLLDRQFPISVLEVVLMGCLEPSLWSFYAPQSKEKARNILDRVGLLHCASQAFGTLSGGEMQRALIARALVSDPSILLLDEATTSIDSVAEENTYCLLESLKGMMTIIMVTHDLEALLKKADRFLCVHRKVTPCSQAEVCDHFIHGLYHPVIKFQRPK